ncbi:transglutaminase-like domain-containing protein [Candidatus Poribacteria bacterium]
MSVSSAQILEKEYGFQLDKMKILNGGLKAWKRAGYVVLRGDEDPSDASSDRYRSVELSYRAVVRDIPEKTSKVSIWIPIPRTNAVQKLIEIQLSSDLPYTLLADKDYNNRFAYVELSGDQIRDNKVSLTAFFRVHRQSYKKRELAEDIRLGMNNPPERFLGPSSLVPIDGKIAKEANAVVRGFEKPFLWAELLFNHIVATLEYDKSETGWGSGDALRARDIRAGDCTDFHSLFIGEARSLGIPARLIMGFPLPSEDKEGTIPGYHCWAEFYIDDHGWIPVDASEARRNWDKKDSYFGNIDAHRIGFTIGRDIHIPRAQDRSVQNYIIYPYAEVDGKEMLVDWKMSFKDS